MLEIESKVNLINEAIRETLDGFSAKTQKAAAYSLYPEGKRYRSLVGLEVYKMLGGNPEKFLTATVGIEYLHNASLIFDDIHDDSPQRRGKKTVHCAFGRDIAELAGLYLLNDGEEILQRNTKEHLRRQDNIDFIYTFIHETVRRLILGQDLDLKKERSDRELNKMLYDKNRIFHFSCLLPLYLIREKLSKKRVSRVQDLLNNIGEDLSVAYQLYDDLRDIEEAPSDGKPTHVDKEKNTSVYRYGAKEVKTRLRTRTKAILKNIREIQRNSGLENLITNVFRLI